MKRPTMVCLLALAACSVVSAQSVGWSSIILAPGTQTNSPNATLQLSGFMTENGTPTPNAVILGPAAVSTSYCWVSAPNFPPSAHSFSMNLSVDGLPGQPLILAATITPGQFICGGFAGAPCATGPFFPNAIPTGSGQYHLDAQPIGIIDSIGSLGGLNVQLDGTGTLGLGLSFPFSSSAPWGTGHVALQALVLDPSAAAGYTFSAAFSLVDWQFFF